MNPEKEYTIVPCTLDELYKTANEEEKEWLYFLKQFVSETDMKWNENGAFYE